MIQLSLNEYYVFYFPSYILTSCQKKTYERILKYEQILKFAHPQFSINFISLMYINLISLSFYLRHVVQSTHTLVDLYQYQLLAPHLHLYLHVYNTYIIQFSINLISLYFYLQALPFQTRIRVYNSSYLLKVWQFPTRIRAG